MVHALPAGEVDDEVLPGFFITIDCRSTYKDAERLVRDSFMKNLRVAGRQPGTGFYVDKVFVITGMRLGKAGASVAGGGSWSRGDTSRKGANEYDSATARVMDPVTNESVKDDWRFTIVASVILEDYGPLEELPGEGSE